MKKIFSFFVAKGLYTTPTNRLLCKVAIFVLVALFALPVMAGTIDVLDNSWIVDHHEEWGGSSYNSETKTITFGGGWAGCGWNLADMGLSTSEWLSITVEFTSTAPKGVLKCEYTDGTNEENFEGKTSQTLNFASGKTLNKIYLQLESSGSLTLTSAVVTTSTTTYTVSVTSSNGTVSGTGDFAEGAEVTLTASPNANYSFTGWSSSDIIIADASANPLVFTMPAKAVSVTANFSPCSGQTVTVNVNDGNMGSATGGGSYCAGVQVDLEATPKSGYRFVNWTVTSGSASLDNVNNASTHFTMSNPAEAVTVRANFEVDPCTNTKTIQCETDRIIPTTGPSAPSELKIITSDHHYSGYHGDGYCDFKGSEGELYYLFSAPSSTYNFTVYLTNVDHAYMNIYTTNSAEKCDETTITYGGTTYYKKSYHALDGPTGDNPIGYRTVSSVSLNGTYIIGLYGKTWTVYDQVVIEASTDVFCPNTITMAKSGDDGAAAPTAQVNSSNVTTAFEGTVVTVTAGAPSDANHYFSGWTASPSVTFSDASTSPATFTMPASNVTITANYTTCTQRTVTLAADNVEHGSVSGGGDYCEGASVTVTATPETSYRFVNWTYTSTGAEASTDAVYTFTLSEDISLTANFEYNPCTNTKTIQCEEGTYQINSALLTKGTSIPAYKLGDGWYSGADGNYVDFDNHVGEIYYIIDLPAATYSFTVYKAHAGDSWLNIWEAGLGDALTYDGVDYGKHDGGGYDIKGDDANGQYTPIHNSTISNVTLSAGTYIIGLYGNNYAVYDKIVITANSNVFCPTYDITMENNMGGAAPTADKVKAEENASVSISAAATIGEFSFTGWTASPEVTFANASAENTTFTMPAEAVTITANYNTYSRTGAPIAAGNYGTICLPLNGTVTGATLYSVAGKEKGDISYLVLEDKGTSLEAGKPYIFQLSADELSVALSGTYTGVQDGNGLVGTYETINPLTSYDDTHHNYILYANAFKKAGTGVTVGAYRAYLNWDEVGAVTPAPSARRIRMVIEGTNSATGLEDLINDQLPVTSKVLIDGQLFIIREGKTYNAQGQMIK